MTTELMRRQFGAQWLDRPKTIIYIYKEVAKNVLISVPIIKVKILHNKRKTKF